VDKHWDHYCALSLVHFLAFPEFGSGEGPILESVARLCDDEFFSVLELSWIKDPAKRTAVAQLIAQSHMQVGFGAQPIILGGKLNLNSLDRAERDVAISALKPNIDQAAEIGAHHFELLSGRDPGAADRSAATAAFADSLNVLCEYARQYQINIVLETFDRDVDKKALIGPAPEAAALTSNVMASSPNFGLLYDMGHMVLLDETPLPAMTLLKEHLVHIHVGNAVKVPNRPSYGDNHPRFGFPGSENDVPQLVEFLRALFAVGYLRESPVRPWVGFEIKPQPGETSAIVLANLKRAWREAWAQV